MIQETPSHRLLGGVREVFAGMPASGRRGYRLRHANSSRTVVRFDRGHRGLSEFVRRSTPLGVIGVYSDQLRDLPAGFQY